MTHPLYALAAATGVQLAASIIALPPADRASFVAACARVGRWVHVDVIEGSYRGQPGVALDDLAGFASVPGVRLDIHLMVDDPIDLARSGTLPRVARMTVELSAGIDPPEAVGAFRPYADEVWLSGEAAPGPAGSGMDGYLLMLTPPGKPGYAADLAQVDALKSHQRSSGLGVDGGVNVDNFTQIAAAGIGYAVVGRALHTHPTAN